MGSISFGVYIDRVAIDKPRHASKHAHIINKILNVDYRPIYCYGNELDRGITVILFHKLENC